MSYFKKQQLRALFRRLMQYTALSRLANGRPVAYKPSYGLDPSTFAMVKTVPLLKEQAKVGLGRRHQEPLMTTYLYACLSTKVNVGIEQKKVTSQVDCALKTRLANAKDAECQVSSSHCSLWTPRPNPYPTQTPDWDTLEIAGQRQNLSQLELSSSGKELTSEEQPQAQARKKQSKKREGVKSKKSAQISRAKQVIESQKMTVDIALQLVAYIYESRLIRCPSHHSPPAPAATYSKLVSTVSMGMAAAAHRIRCS